jgi:hypothetical protein
MLIGALLDELVWPAPVLVLELLPLLLQAASTPTESATALRVMTFLENQGRVALTPGSSFLSHVFSGVEPVGDIGVLISRVFIPAGSACCATNAANSTSP